MRKYYFTILLLLSFILISAQRQDFTTKFYGFIRNDFFFNSRLSEEAIDGTFHMTPKPIILDANGLDINAKPQAEMLSMNSRLGFDIIGKELFGAKSSAKIEADFAGTGSTFFLMRIRQAYMQLNWKNSSLLLGQTWHPMFGTVSPTSVSFNAGTPFQPFARSPQIRLNYKLTDNIGLTGAALYQMQYTSNGPVGFSNTYMKNSLRPNLFASAEYKKDAITAGLGFDYKRLKPDAEYISSLSAMAYGQYIKPKFQVKTKVTLGQNLSDLLMIGGYGKYFDSNRQYHYTNLKTLSSWLNVVYGKKWQVGVFGGYLNNLGSLFLDPVDGKYIVYGRGFYADTQQIMNSMYRVAPFLQYNQDNLSLGIEYNLTDAEYGTISWDGRGKDPYHVQNHRFMATVIYNF